MNKDEILRKCREQKEDEGMIHADNSGRRYGFIGLTIMFAAHVILVLFCGFVLCFAAVVFFLSYLLWDLLKVMG